MRRILLTILAVGLAGCAPSKNDTVSASEHFAGILGGEAVTDQDTLSKSTVAVIDTLQGGTCTGTLITKNIVVTAAHCVQSGARFMKVGFGVSLAEATQVKAADLTPHARYAEAMTELEGILQKIVDVTTPGDDRNKQVFAALDEYKNWGDVALIKMSADAPEGYAPAEILEDGRYVQNGAVITLAGYGITKPYSEQNPTEEEETILRKVDIKVHNAVYSETEVAFDQTEGKGACHGDSGGPAYVKVGEKMKLFGITSRGLADPEDSCRQYSGYSYLPSFKVWMGEQVTAWENPEPAETPAEQTIATTEE